MIYKVFSTILILSFCSNASARLNDNIFRNSENKFYWQNRKPDAAYWQQDVEYKIWASISEETNTIEGVEILTYWNNSPDTLNEVYFHLYQNAFVKGSYLHDLEIVNKVKPHLGKREDAGLGIVISEIQVDGQSVKTVMDNTILKVLLPTPLYPGKKVIIKSSFKTLYDKGATRRRMQMYNAWGFMHYNGTQWYPKICVYDRMHGWDTYQHLNKEFYGDFGLFDVTLDFPSNYIVEATGVLQNKKEVLPDSLLKKINIKNFAAKKWNEPPSTIIPYLKGERKQWHYIANNVHDFAFTADPSFRLASENWNGVECVAMVQEPHAAGWQNATDYLVKIIKTFSEDIGMFCYPKIVAADAQDGMEYPMITMDGGSEPGYRGLFTHEIGHNWFYGQVGNNETYRAAMDEGFTQFLTAWGLRRIDGDTTYGTWPKSKFRRLFWEPALVIDKNVLTPYTMDALNQNETAINTHSDDFNSALNHGGGYREVYFKTASMLYNLQYVLGDSLFKSTIQLYFEQWKFAHPYFEDFRASVIQFTHVDLSWFFDEWFETTKTLDYEIGRIHRIAGTDSFSIKFKRKGEMQMPIDFTVTTKNGEKYSYYIPNTWFTKETEATVLPKWYGWGKLNTCYTANVKIPNGIKNVQIDTSFRFADKDMIDNYKTCGRLLSPLAYSVKFDGGVAPQTDRRKYRFDLRPDLWWNPIDGIKAGVHFEGDYLFSLYKVDGSIWINTHALQEDAYKPIGDDGTFKVYNPINYTINYNTPVTRNMPKLQVQINSRFLDGLWYQRLGMNWLISDHSNLQFFGQSLWCQYTNGFDYLLSPNDWSSYDGHPNSSFNAVYTHRYNYFGGAGKYIFSIRTPMLTDAFDYSYIQMEAINYKTIGKLDVRTRVFGRYGKGNQIPYESALYLAGANPEEMMDNKYTRAIGFVPTDWQGVSSYDETHFQQGGGLNLRGYTGYFSPDEKNGSLLECYKGRSGASANIEIGFENYLPYSPRFTKNWLHVNLYAFSDGGIMEMSNFSPMDIHNIQPNPIYWSNFHFDAGAGAALTIKKWGVFEKAKPLTIRVDLPVFLNRPPYNNNAYATLRYVIGINRAF